MRSLNYDDYQKNTEKKEIKRPKFVNFILLCTGGTAAAITLVTIPFLSPAFRQKCLPYVPATSIQIANLSKALRNNCSGKLVDLGSGDGRIVRSAAAMGFKAVGVELNIWLILYSRFLSLIKGLSSSTEFHRKNLWVFNLKPYRNVVIFGTENMMHDVEEKFLNELSNGSVVVTCRFPLPNLKADEVIGEGIDAVWRYEIKSAFPSKVT